MLKFCFTWSAVSIRLCILKTGIGGAPLISRMLDSLGESTGILGTLAGDDTIFIAPTDVNRIGEITKEISLLLGVSTQS